MAATDLRQGTTILWPPTRLMPDLDQPRQEHNWDIEGTAANMMDLRERGLGIGGTGVLKSLLVRLPPGALDAQGRLKSDVSLPIVDGEGRWRSACFANEQHEGSIPLLPVTLQDVSADDAFEIAYYANAYTKPMSELDHALALLKIKRRHNLSYSELARRTKHPRDYVRSRVEAVAEPDTLPILEQRPDAITIVRRINQLEHGPLRDELIQMALGGATFPDINDTITARREGLEVERLRAERDVRKYERAHAQEAIAASSSVPVGAQRPSKGVTKTAAFLGASPAPESSSSKSSGLHVQPYIGDALDTLNRQLEDAKSGLLEARLSPERRTELIEKAILHRSLTDELIFGLQSGQK